MGVPHKVRISVCHAAGPSQRDTPKVDYRGVQSGHFGRCVNVLAFGGLYQRRCGVQPIPKNDGMLGASPGTGCLDPRTPPFVSRKLCHVGILVVLQPLQAQGTFFHNALGTQGNFGVKPAGQPLFDCIVVIELPSTHGTIGTTEPGTGATLVHHGTETIGRVRGGTRGANFFARGIPAMETHGRGPPPHFNPVHKLACSTAFLGRQGNVVLLHAGQNALSAAIAGIQVYGHAKAVQGRCPRLFQGRWHGNLDQIKTWLGAGRRHLDFVHKIFQARHGGRRIESHTPATCKSLHQEYYRTRLYKLTPIHKPLSLTMTSSAVYCSRLKIFFPERLSCVAIHAHLHGIRLAPCKPSPIVGTVQGPVTVGTLHPSRIVESVVEHHVLGKDILVIPGEFPRKGQKGVQLFYARFFSQREAVAIQAILLGWHMGATLEMGSPMTMATVKPDGIPMKRMVKGYLRHGLQFGHFLTEH